MKIISILNLIMCIVCLISGVFSILDAVKTRQYDVIHKKDIVSAIVNLVFSVSNLISFVIIINLLN